ncbi:C39 family peptidase [Noviherbaspirillum sp. UKPF54]|uniref:C39 family peptidase n=1 Tax=Noviherbaspirillum sp. UKPF54 TaxID=2601898 RepID=UPI001AEFBE61|nr:C39 family peptidase [Noviherbaspirillum sp. UKPF54]
MKRMHQPYAVESSAASARWRHRAVNMACAGCCALLYLLPAVQAFAGERAVRSLLEMRHENVVIQQWDLSCGAAALATLLKYQHGEPVTEKEVALSLMKREEYIKNPQLIQSREGFSLLDLKRHVDARGYLGSGYGKLQLKDLVAKAPLIVPIKTHGYNHFVVFRGMYRDRALLADPAWGNRTMPVDEFMEHWIEYPSLGRIGFTVQRRDGVIPPNQLAPTENDFLTLR